MRNMRARFTAREWIFLTLGIANITVLVILAYFGCNLDGHRPHSSSEVLVALELEPNFTPVSESEISCRSHLFSHR